MEKNTKLSFFIYLIYGLTIFVSAFLLFQVQPLISKYILPWFGGTNSVWTVCILFFQTILLFGYLYAHLISKYFSNKKQIFIHLALLIIAIISLPILPQSTWAPTANDNPAFHILLLLTVAVAMPAFILAATSPLLQNWFSKINTKKSPYKLYALSNAGSLIALLSFPFVFEQFMPINVQASFWTTVFIIFALLCSFVAVSLWKFSNTSFLKTEPGIKTNPKLKTKLSWLGLSACTSILLLSVTEKITLDISVVPFLWVAPLSLYLLTFIIAFSKTDEKKHRNKNLLLYILFLSIISLFLFIGLENIIMQVITYSLILFLFCLVCHNELVRLKPAVAHLTSFYVIIASGGIIGGIFTGIIAPNIFNTYFELPLILTICSMITLYVFLRTHDAQLKFKKLPLSIIQIIYSHKNKAFAFKLKLKELTTISLIICFFFIGSGGLIYANEKSKSKIIKNSRNFYGALIVQYPDNTENNSNELLFLLSGHILHGSQFIQENKRKIPTTYYGVESGIGLLFDYCKNEKKRVGAIGLGTGTIALYGKKGDYFKFYEINPEVKYLSKKYFTYLDDSAAQIEISLGDGRLSLKREMPQNYDILIIDAFTSDSIPVHLLTKEAVEIYLKHLKTDGVIAAHVSNRHINLTPIVLKLAQYYDINTKIIQSKGHADTNTLQTTWILLSNNDKMLKSINGTEKIVANQTNIDQADLWTDDYSNILKILK